ncbi:hypothetical protein D3C77_457520 [compost metagenome]
MKTAVGVKYLLIHTNIGRNGVNFRIVFAVFHSVHIFSHNLLDIGSMFIDKLREVNNRIGIYQGSELSFGVNQIRVLSASGHQSDFALPPAAAYIEFRI